MCTEQREFKGKGQESGCWLGCDGFPVTSTFCLLILHVWGHKRKCFPPSLCTTRLRRVKVCVFIRYVKGDICMFSWLARRGSSELTLDLTVSERSDSPSFPQIMTSSPS